MYFNAGASTGSCSHLIVPNMESKNTFLFPLILHSCKLFRNGSALHRGLCILSFNREANTLNKAVLDHKRFKRIECLP